MTGAVGSSLPMQAWLAVAGLPVGWGVARAARWFDRRLDVILDHGLVAGIGNWRAIIAPLRVPRRPHVAPPDGEVAMDAIVSEHTGGLSIRDGGSRSGYPTLEIFAAVLLSGVGLTAGSSARAVAGGLFCAALLLCAWVDWRSRILPDVVVIPLLAAGAVLAIGWHLFVGLGPALAGMVLGWAMASVTRWLGRGRGGFLGAGDVKLLSAVGGWLGPLAVAVIFLAASASMGAIMVLHRKSHRVRLWCFGPALAGGAIVYLLLVLTVFGDMPVSEACFLSDCSVFEDCCEIVERSLLRLASIYLLM